MDWNGLGLNLLSEAIGIAATVFLVDRLIKRREDRSWRQVRETLLEQAQFVSEKVWASFEIWFEALDTTGSRQVESTFNELFDLASVAALSAVGENRLQTAADQLAAALKADVLPTSLAEDRHWTKFYQDVFPLLQSFESLAARYAAVMDPELSLITIRIRRDIDLLDVLSRAPQQTFDHDLNDRLAGLITSLLLEIARLTRYARSHRTGTAPVWQPRVA